MDGQTGHYKWITTRERNKVRWIAETFWREGHADSWGDFRSALEFITQFLFQLGVRLSFYYPQRSTEASPV